jgi:hypothetical protein
MLLVVTSVLAFLGGQAVAATAKAGAPGCDPSRLGLRVAVEGTMEQMDGYLMESYPSRSHCAVSGSVVFRVDQHGELARIVGNPLTERAQTEGSPMPNGSEPIAQFWWGNWCGSSRDITIEASYRGQTVRWRASRDIPYCFRHGRSSLDFGGGDS